MQKINRDALQEALRYRDDYYEDDSQYIKYDELIKQAAALLLEITGEDWEVPEEMVEAGRYGNVDFEYGEPYVDAKEVFKDMIKELVE